MGFQSTGGGFLIKDANGVTKFASAMENYIETDFLSGSFGIPRRDITNSSYNQVQTYALGACLPAALVVMGAVRIVRADAFATGFLEIAPVNAWNAVGGSLILGAGRGTFDSSGNITGDGPLLVGVQTLTFRSQGGVVYADEAMHAHSQPAASIQQQSYLGSPAWTIHFKLSIGLFDR